VVEPGAGDRHALDLLAESGRRQHCGRRDDGENEEEAVVI
jgi:hypothetical protein